MQHLGEVMFVKGLFLALCAAIGVQWVAFRKRRAEKGLPLKLNPRTGIYEVSDWAAWLERNARGLWNGVIVFAAVGNVAIWVALAVLGKVRVAQFFAWIFGF